MLNVVTIPPRWVQHGKRQPSTKSLLICFKHDIVEPPIGARWFIFHAHSVLGLSNATYYTSITTTAGTFTDIKHLATKNWIEINIIPSSFYIIFCFDKDHLWPKSCSLLDTHSIINTFCFYSSFWI